MVFKASIGCNVSYS